MVPSTVGSNSNFNDAVQVYTDGLCAPVNPGGWACWAWVALAPDGHEIAFDCGCLGHSPDMTNNVAEAEAILQALQWAHRNRLGFVILHSDSQLIVNQVLGRWAVNASHLVPLVRQARQLLAEVDGKIEWIRREANTRADRLTRLAYARARRREVAHA